MADINLVVLVGRLTKDAELKYITSGQAVCKFSVAINRRRKNGDQWEDEVNYFDIVLWGRQGESLNPYLQKGKLVGIEGELRQERWTDQNGQNRNKVEIVANNIQLLGGNPGGHSGQGGGAQGSGAGASGNQGFSQGNRGEAAPPRSDDEFTDDIPF